MNKSKVYYTNLRVKPGDSLLMKLERLIRAAGIDTIDFTGKFTAIKIHFGEPGNLAYLRPNYAKAVADVVKSLGGKPFLTDCNTICGGQKGRFGTHGKCLHKWFFSFSRLDAISSSPMV